MHACIQPFLSRNNNTIFVLPTSENNFNELTLIVKLLYKQYDIMHTYIHQATPSTRRIRTSASSVMKLV